MFNLSLLDTNQTMTGYKSRQNLRPGCCFDKGLPIHRTDMAPLYGRLGSRSPCRYECLLRRIQSVEFTRAERFGSSE